MSTLPRTARGAGCDTLVKHAGHIQDQPGIISRPDVSFDEGCEIGKLGRHPRHNASTFLNTIVLSELPARRVSCSKIEAVLR